MKQTLVLILGLSSVALACADAEPTAVLDVYEPEALMSVTATDGSRAVATLSGGEEVPARSTRARGTATFKLSDDGAEMSYRLIVANIENVVASHIHIAPAGANGGVVQFLYPNQPAGEGRVNGVLAEGTFTSASFVGVLAGQPMSSLVDAMVAGNAYVNVHTNDGIAPTNTGPGDFASGEVRGQIR